MNARLTFSAHRLAIMHSPTIRFTFTTVHPIVSDTTIDSIIPSVDRATSQLRVHAYRQSKVGAITQFVFHVRYVSFPFVRKLVLCHLISHDFFTSRSAASRSPMYTTFTKIELIAKHICFICSARGMFAQNVDKQCSKTCRYHSLFSKKITAVLYFFPFFNNSVFL